MEGAAGQMLVPILGIVAAAAVTFYTVSFMEMRDVRFAVPFLYILACLLAVACWFPFQLHERYDYVWACSAASSTHDGLTVTNLRFAEIFRGARREVLGVRRVRRTAAPVTPEGRARQEESQVISVPGERERAEEDAVATYEFVDLEISMPVKVFRACAFIGEFV
jgi:hypothetical protein